MKFFLTGLIIALVLLLLGILTPFHKLLLTITFALAVVCLLLAGVLSNVFVSGDRMRANLASESREDTKKRMGLGGRLFLFGISQLGASVLLFVIYP
ncbi:DUF5316 domain-containing protein [Sporolactobacillus sp. CPB3-1]|uniref:DUF5316 domain-containing protein n=1 Tax=Sporolactobacillus mangiferae TaxID=2940498 RepID=A0ABT0MCS4_9BACL|nr:DUF5316 domain-containing protein [Sporolactobacillus mangiferae]